MSETTELQRAVAEHMANAPEALREYVCERLKELGKEIGVTPIDSFHWDESIEGFDFWRLISEKLWSNAMATDFWLQHLQDLHPEVDLKEGAKEFGRRFEAAAKVVAHEERPKGVIGQWYTLISDFGGDGFSEYKKAGYTWQCEKVDRYGEPMIDGILMNFDESYRLATPEEIEKTKRQQGEQETDEAKPYDYINPDHYKQGSKEVIDMMIDIWGPDVVATYCEINAFKYRMRLGNKPDQPIERDLQKAQWYENKAKELKG